MSKTNEDQILMDAINNLTEKVSQFMLQEFLTLPETLQLNIVLIKTAQLLLANILCHVANDKTELEKVVEDQGIELKELTFNCALTGFADKYHFEKH